MKNEVERKSKDSTKRIYFDTYLAVIKNSIGCKSFRNFYVQEGMRKYDALKNGQLSCAFFVSGILKMFDLITNLHGTVKGTVADLEKSGWKKIAKPKEGAILVWQEQKFGDENHAHVGFYAGGNKAVSNNVKKGYPIEHDWQFDGKRKVMAIYWKEII